MKCITDPHIMGTLQEVSTQYIHYVSQLIRTCTHKDVIEAPLACQLKVETIKLPHPLLPLATVLT